MISRQTAHPQFTNKNAELDNSEVDANFIEVIEKINKLNGLDSITAYAGGMTY